MSLTIVDGFPPIMEMINKAFNLKDSKPVFAWGLVLYNPYGLRIDRYTMVHEATHSIQQDATGPEAWWIRYCEDVAFRLEQELQAYRHQYIEYTQTVADRNRRARYLMKLAANLSGPLYNNMCTFDYAFKQISNA